MYVFAVFHVTPLMCIEALDIDSVCLVVLLFGHQFGRVAVVQLNENMLCNERNDFYETRTKRIAT